MISLLGLSLTLRHENWSVKTEVRKPVNYFSSNLPYLLLLIKIICQIKSCNWEEWFGPLNTNCSITMLLTAGPHSGLNICVLPKFTGKSPSLGCFGTWRQGLWEVIRSWGWHPRAEIYALEERLFLVKM